MKQITIFLSMLFALTMIQGCSKGSSSSAAPSAVRLVNATSDYASLDMSLISVVPASSVATAVTSGAASSYATITPGTSKFSLERTGSGTPSAQTTLTLSSGVDYTLVAYTSGQQMQVMPLVDNEVAPSSGDGKIRIMNLSPDAGSVNVYMGVAGSSVSAASTLASYVTGTTSYFEVTQGTYHIWITGAIDQTDLRLDIPSVTISDQQVMTLVLTGTTGGVLVDGLFVTQQGAVSAQKNTSARMRVAANIAANGSIAVTANGVALGSTLRSPLVSSYFLVPAGALSMNVVVNGSTLSTPPASLNAAAGADLTLLAAGSATTPQFFLLNDDNRRALNGTAKIRVVNGVNGLSDNVSLIGDFYQLAYNVAFGTASAPASVSTTNPISLLEVDSLQGTVLDTFSNVGLQSTGAYSVFMLGDNVTPVGVLRRDR